MLLAGLLLLLAADYALYPLLARPGGRSFDRGENGLWLRSRWYFGQQSDAAVRAMARRLREHRIRYACCHVRHITREGRLAYRYPEAAPARRRRSLRSARSEGAGVDLRGEHPARARVGQGGPG